MKAKVSFTALGLVVLVTLLVLWAHALATKQANAVRVPVLGVCLEDAKALMRATPEGAAIDTKYIAFDAHLQSHPAVKGYIEVTSTRYDPEFLTTIANGYVAGCKIDTTIEFKKSDPNAASRLFDNLQALEREGAQGIYLLTEPSAVRLLFRSSS